MRIGKLTNKRNYELKMQHMFKIWLNFKSFPYLDEYYVKAVKRRPDFLILKGRQLINVEAKDHDLGHLIEQMRDNAKYCDYSFAFIPDYCQTPRWFKEELIKLGFGLIIYNWEKDIITEALEAHLNTRIDKDLKKLIIDKLK